MQYKAINQRPQNIDIIMVKGDDLKTRVDVGLDITDYTIEAHVNTVPQIDFTITPIDLVEGSFYLSLSSADSADVPDGAGWSMEWDDADGLHRTICTGVMKMLEDK
jgi:hypothetical protein